MFCMPPMSDEGIHPSSMMGSSLRNVSSYLLTWYILYISTKDLSLYNLVDILLLLSLDLRFQKSAEQYVSSSGGICGLLLDKES